MQEEYEVPKEERLQKACEWIVKHCAKDLFRRGVRKKPGGVSVTAQTYELGVQGCFLQVLLWEYDFEKKGEECMIEKIGKQIGKELFACIEDLRQETLKT